MLLFHYLINISINIIFNIVIDKAFKFVAISTASCSETINRL